MEIKVVFTQGGTKYSQGFFKEVICTANRQQKYFSIKVQVFTASVLLFKFQVKSIILIVNLICISAVRSHQMTQKADMACFVLGFIGFLVSVVGLMMME